MDYVCIKECNNSASNLYPNDKVYFYEKWKVYQYYITAHYTRNTIYSNSSYCGWVTNEFIKEYFMLKTEFDVLLNEIDGIFEGNLI